MTKAEADLDVSLLGELVRLDAETGDLYWKPRMPRHFTPSARKSSEHLCSNWNSRYASTRALACIAASGHLTGRIFDRLFYAHRVVFALTHGRWPSMSIDHIDGNPANNRPGNLRDVSHAENHKNQFLRKNSTHGVLGVSWNARLRKWMAHITVNGKYHHLGFHYVKDDAAAARRQAEVRFGFFNNQERSA